MDNCESESVESISDIEEMADETETEDRARSRASVVSEVPGAYWQEGGDNSQQRASSGRSPSWSNSPRPTASPRKGSAKHTNLNVNLNGLGMEERSSGSFSSKEEKHQPQAQQVHNEQPPALAAVEPSPRGSESDEPGELPAVIPINVGGYRFMTRLSTLCKFPDSMLAAMFSGRHKLDRDKHGYYFIDSNGIYFGYILDFLRHETVPPMDVAIHVYKEACYYNIAPLVEKLQSSPPVARNVVRDLHRAQFPDYYGLKQRIIKQAIDNAVVNQTGEVVIFAFQKVFTPRAPYFNTQHECVADLANVSVGPWDSPADEEVLVRCLEQDLQMEGFKIKPHEQRRRCKYYNGQNCQKSVYKITFYFA